jgi:REP element-mobilizing transposase RayT
MNPTNPRPPRPAPPQPVPTPNRPRDPAPPPTPQSAPPEPGEATPITYSIQMRLADSLPEGGIDAWRAEIEEVAARENLEEIEVRRRLARRIEHELNEGHGSCWLGQPEIAGLVAECLKASHGKRQQLRAWVVLANRIQAVVTLAPGADVMALVRQWKASTSRDAAQRLDVDPRMFWERGAFVRPCRDETDAGYRIRDVEFLPVNAGLCKRPRDWQWSSAYGSPAPGPRK